MLPNTILKECKQFLTESKDKPLIKSLPTSGEGFRKIKIRKKNRYVHPFEQYFDKAFNEKYKEIRLRSMIVQTDPTFRTCPQGSELFYVFPTNGYKILYNQYINDYSSYANTLHKLLTESTTVEGLMSQLFQVTYESNNISEAIDSGAELLIYDIQYYYAIRMSLIDDYTKFVTHCNN